MENGQYGSNTHHVNAGLINMLSETLNFGKRPIMICSVKGVEFDFGEGLSPAALQNADKAVKAIINWIYRL